MDTVLMGEAAHAGVPRGVIGFRGRGFERRQKDLLALLDDDIGERDVAAGIGAADVHHFIGLRAARRGRDRGRDFRLIEALDRAFRQPVGERRA